MHLKQTWRTALKLGRLISEIVINAGVGFLVLDLTQPKILEPKRKTKIKLIQSDSSVKQVSSPYKP